MMLKDKVAVIYGAGGVPLAELDAEQFSLPITTYATSYFLTARLAARRMVVLATSTHPRRLMTLAEMANVAAFMASDKASGMTGTTVNLTLGSLDD
jgi:enoyl-[acyl-carrier-protein] reductase (NADH)